MAIDVDNIQVTCLTTVLAESGLGYLLGLRLMLTIADQSRLLGAYTGWAKKTDCF